MRSIHIKVVLLTISISLFVGCASTPIKDLKPSEFLKEMPKSKYLDMKTPKGLNRLETGLWAYKHYYIKEAVRLLTPYKDKGNAEVEHAFGWMYHNGKGLDQDFKKAIQHYKKAIEINNYPISLNNLSILYSNGQGVSRNTSKSIELLKESAKGGYVNAQFSLGKVYLIGQKVSEDYGMAYYWLQQASHNGHRRAPYTIGQMYESGYGVEENQQKALDWYKKAGERGSKFGADAAIRLQYQMDVKSGKREKAPNIIIR